MDPGWKITGVALGDKGAIETRSIKYLGSLIATPWKPSLYGLAPARSWLSYKCPCYCLSHCGLLHWCYPWPAAHFCSWCSLTRVYIALSTMPILVCG